MGNAYSRAGVDVEAGYEVVERIKKHVKRTERLGVMGAIGGFGGCFDLSQFDVKEPVLVSGTDGVGTKLMVAIQADKHDTIGIDCVAMCVNDIVAQGAEPLYFLDYIATGKNVPARLEQVVAGVAEGCVQAGAALIGGETAEMPGMYGEDDYDLAGFTVGIAEKSQMITGEKISEGDILVGLPSSGIHSNGYSLVRKIFFETNHFSYDEKLPELSGTLSDEILTPTKIYVDAVMPLIKKELVNGIAHVTGGGFVENLPRMLPDALACEIHLDAWPVLPIFDALAKYGKIPEMEMYEIFNMGIGMVLAVSPEKLDAVKADLTERNEAFFLIGKVTKKEEAAILFKGKKKMRIAVLASGNGSNFEVIAQAVKDKEIPAELVLLFSDHRDAYVLERGKKFSIPCESFELKEFPDKKSYEAALLKELKTHEVELVVLAGYMRIIGEDLLTAFPNRIVNIHPALLPDFPGLHGIRDAYEAGVKETGVTIHYVDRGVDTGPIIAQGKVSVAETDSLSDLETKIHAVEHQLYPQVLAEIVKESNN